MLLLYFKITVFMSDCFFMFRFIWLCAKKVVSFHQKKRFSIVDNSVIQQDDYF